MTTVTGKIDVHHHMVPEFYATTLSRCDFVLDKEGKFPQGTLHYLKQFYYDTALSPSPYMLGSVRELIGMDRLLGGHEVNIVEACANHNKSVFTVGNSL